MGWWVIAVLPSLLVLPGLARADAGEWRVGAGAGGMVITTRVGSADGTGVGYGAHGRLGRGLSNTIELGLVGRYAHASDLEFDDASVDGQTGALFTDMSTFTAAAELRWTPGVGLARAFERTGPYVAARAGGALRMRTSQQLFTATRLLISDVGDDLHLSPFAGGAIGGEHRFGEHFFIATELAVSFGVEEREFGLTAEAAWAWY